MGRSPCCEKVGLKKGPWTPEEDQKLLAYIEENGHGSWRALPAKAGLQRCGKSCRLRWTNYLRPDIKRGKFSMQEEQTIIQLHALLGNRWSAIATHLPKRTDNEIKNYWNTHLKKRLAKMGIDPVTHKPKSDSSSPTDIQSNSKSTAANLSHMAQWESARLEAEARLAKESKFRTTVIQTPTNTASSVDIFQAWQGVWPSTSTSNSRQAVAFNSGASATTRTDLDSPTSTIVVAENVGTNNNNNSLGLIENIEPVTEELLEWSYLPEKQQNCVGEVSYTSSWPLAEPVSLRRNGEEFGVTGFTGLLLLDDATEEHHGSSEGCGDSGGSCVEGEENKGEENKNYWNNILNLVNSASPSNSPPVF